MKYVCERERNEKIPKHRSENYPSESVQGVGVACLKFHVSKNRN